MQVGARNIRWLVWLGASVAIAAPAVAQIDASADLLISQEDARPSEVEPWRPTPWSVQIEPMLWWAGLNGELRAPGSTSDAQIDDLKLDDTEFRVGFEAAMRFEDVHTFRVSGFVFDTDASDTTDRPITLGSLNIPAGGAYNADISFSSVQATYAWETWRRTMSSSTGARRGADLRIDLYGGVRYYDYSYELESAGGSVRENQQWVDLIAGLRLEAEFTEKLSFDLAVDVGGFWAGDQSSGSANVITGFQWRPNGNIGAQIGYRFLFASVYDDDGIDEESFSGSLAGLYASVVFRF